MGLKRVADRIWTCSSAGECIGKGPTNPFGGPSPPLGLCAPAERFKYEDYTARGRLYLCRLLYNNLIAPTADNLAKVAYTCTACGFCDEVCTLRPLEAFMALREELVERGVAPPEANRKEDENVRIKHNALGGLPEARARWAQGLNLSKTGDMLYFAGCYASYRQPETSRATVKILKAAGIDVAHLSNDEWCCGLPPLWNGERTIAEKTMKHNLEAIRNSGAKTIVVSCAECYKTLKIDYPKILGELPVNVVHTAELFTHLIDEGKLRFNKLEENVTYHDPCFLGRHSKVYDEPRKVIKSIPGVELTEMERSGQWAFCCGSGAGVVGMAYPDFTGWTARQRVIEAKKAADTIVTACPRCIETLRGAAATEGIKVIIYDLPVFAAKALG